MVRNHRQTRSHCARELSTTASVSPKTLGGELNYYSQGDIIDFRVSGNKIVLEPKELILKDKYPLKDLRTAEEVLSKGKAGKELSFKSGKGMVCFFKKRTKK